ncbi:prepilin-type N-terminal cleavage/methylation domain-containing protein [Cryobacterium sp. RTC2.1]|uniref:prepilin-type N-terminal cleavage/methylation domain-containing protein n=1 Tax=Cryobacterium sp. RTC2.1 TaxID=3048634 RepID=UPI002B230340|nr:prepilin-type N-terminal cleavage/methylation domain-containing protein [Cryobacterium sp. RTC2.1]MEB0002151.1 prepilin-type N-terminal cleavage/methylation domain-containing protein [Cryobacterium sp. RTC2.1]
MSRRIRVGYQSDSGFSLAELLVAMAIFGVIMAIVMGFFASATRASRENAAIGTNTESASNGMNEISRILRASTENPVINQAIDSPAFVSAGTGNEIVTIYAYVNLSSAAEQPVKVQFSLDSNRNLIETRWAGTPITAGYWSFTSGVPTTRTLAGAVITRTGTNPYLFTYRAKDGTPIPVPTAGFTDADLRTIASIQVTIAIGATSTATTAIVTLQNTVGLPNLDIARTL